MYLSTILMVLGFGLVMLSVMGGIRPLPRP